MWAELLTITKIIKQLHTTVTCTQIGTSKMCKFTWLSIESICSRVSLSKLSLQCQELAIVIYGTNIGDTITKVYNEACLHIPFQPKCALSVSV